MALKLALLAAATYLFALAGDTLHVIPTSCWTTTTTTTDQATGIPTTLQVTCNGAPR